MNRIDAPITIGDLLRQGVARAPGQEIVHGTASRYTYATLADRVSRLAGALASLGVKPGSTVAVMDWDTPRYLEAFFAVPMMGAVLHTVNVRISPEQILRTLDHARDDVILVNADFLPIVDAIASRVRPEVRWVLIDDRRRPRPAYPGFLREYESMLADASPDYAFPELNDQARATTFYTSGTTGAPKGVFYTHRQVVLHTLAVAHALGNAPHATFDQRDVYMPMTPMFHVHAWGLPYVATLLGAKQVYPGRSSPASLVSLIEAERVTFSQCMPTLLRMVLRDAPQGDLARWKVMVGGSALPLALARAALERGIDLISAYGSSETGPVLTLAHLRPHMDRWSAEERLPYLCRAGRAVPFVQLRVVDADMNDVAADSGTPGEIVVRAPWLVHGYLHDEAGSAQLWRGGWLHTGDVGCIDAEGYLRIADRMKDVVRTGGEWVSSLEIEDIILRLPQVAEAAVVAIPDEHLGERPVAFVVARNGEACASLAEAVRTHVASFAADGAISRHAVPQHIHFVDAIPKTSVGKLDKKVMRARVLAWEQA